MWLNSVNDAPVFVNLDKISSYTENGSAVALDNNVTLVDAELSALNDFTGATLTLNCTGGASPDHQLAFDGVAVTTSGASVFVGGVLVGS